MSVLCSGFGFVFDGEADDVFDDLENEVQRTEAIGEFHGLSPQHVVGRLDLNVRLLFRIDALLNLVNSHLQSTSLATLIYIFFNKPL